MELNNEIIQQVIHDSQHCQRNWDLSQEIPQQDIDSLMTAVTQCPSKQNIAHYKVHAITNRTMITAIHEHTVGFAVTYEPYVAETNSQVLANLLLVFEAQDVQVHNDSVQYRNDETKMIKDGVLTPEAQSLLMRDRQMSVGIATGYCNITASLLGYNTGYCACFDNIEIKKLLGAQGDILVMLGIGFKDPVLDRRIHHVNHDFMFPTRPKQPIQVNWIR